MPVCLPDMPLLAVLNASPCCCPYQVLYHNCPGQRTLLITHSNQALNDLFAKMVARWVCDARV